MKLREEALKQLQQFSEQHLASYAAKRIIEKLMK